jgi:hypothetical protein
MRAGLKVPAPTADLLAVRLRPERVSYLLRDERGIVVSFMVRLVVVLALIGILFVEGGAIVFSKLQAQDIAESAAVAGAGSLSHTHSANTARGEALRWIEDKSARARMTAFTARPDGSVTVTVRLRANTVLLQHIGFLAPYTLSRATATADPPDPAV